MKTHLGYTDEEMKKFRENPPTSTLEA